jgi:hypothetical protein
MFNDKWIQHLLSNHQDVKRDAALIGYVCQLLLFLLLWVT